MQRPNANNEWTPALRLQAMALAQAFPSIPLLAINHFLTGSPSSAEPISLLDDAEKVLAELSTVELDTLGAHG
jgi:hypothetical protein